MSQVAEGNRAGLWRELDRIAWRVAIVATGVTRIAKEIAKHDRVDLLASTGQREHNMLDKHSGLRDIPALRIPDLEGDQAVDVVACCANAMLRAQIEEPLPVGHGEQDIIDVIIAIIAADQPVGINGFDSIVNGLDHMAIRLAGATPTTDAAAFPRLVPHIDGLDIRVLVVVREVRPVVLPVRNMIVGYSIIRSVPAITDIVGNTIAGPIWRAVRQPEQVHLVSGEEVDHAIANAPVVGAMRGFLLIPAGAVADPFDAHLLQALRLHFHAYWIIGARIANEVRVFLEANRRWIEHAQVAEPDLGCLAGIAAVLQIGE